MLRESRALISNLVCGVPKNNTGQLSSIQGKLFWTGNFSTRTKERRTPNNKGFGSNFSIAFNKYKSTNSRDVKGIKELLHICRKNNTFHAAEIWSEIKRQNIKLDKQCFGMLSYTCYKARDAKTAQELWQVVGVSVKPGLMDCTQLVQALSSQPNKDTISAIWNYMVHLSPDSVACVGVLNACRSPFFLPTGMEVHKYITQNSLLTPHSKFDDQHTTGTEVHQYIARNSLLTPRHTKFDDQHTTGTEVHQHIARNSLLTPHHTKFDDQHMVLYTALLNMYRQCGRADRVISLWQENRKNIPTNIYTYSALLSACADLRNFNAGEEIHHHMLQQNIQPDTALYNSLMYFYIKCGNPFKAISIWQKMNSSTKFPQPNISTYTNILIACGDSGSLGLGKKVHSIITKRGLHHDPILESTLIKMYADCGSIDSAVDVFKEAKTRGNINVIVWTTMINAFGQHGESQKALGLFHELENQIQPNVHTFTAVLTACSHTKLVSKAVGIYKSMESVYGVTPNLDHSNAIVDVLARAGRLQEAEDFANELPSPDVITWKTILGACRTHNDLPRAERVAQRALKLDSQDPAVYVLMANIYASAKKWDESKRMREQMEAQGVTKTPGKSWIEVNGKISYFLVNDKSHPLSSEIYAQIEELKKRLKKEGFASDTCYVMHDIEEEQKEELIWYHSEKLALAYGLLKLPPTQRITIIKNLRVCGDCHAALEYASKVYKRDIVVRDANRFHHFRNGKCSCKGYF